jgi:hypothetical protein
MKQVWTTGEMILTGNNRSIKRKICARHILSTTNPTFEIRKVVAKLLKNPSRTANKGGPSAWGLGVGLTTSPYKE